ncbi:ATP-binding cassette subfamily B protein [Oikeobacillus pervagus]|uniref:ATP-binding cassette subfamily B protein n=1 Tax=Oikeobacillus pervagus TaxID=1325931 RepID=A0AAJ1WKJ0_9BACI|nr:ABC transporter ATP-binding protein [Oikeobacillus pervagus]MDQ0216658.1 ATP-binding cassette subfamily B protein [Oikeobacillus pervagus]
MSRHHPPMKTEKAKDTVSTLKRLFAYFSNHQGKVYLVLFMVVCSSVLGILGPYLLGMAIDHYVGSKQFDTFLRFLLMIGVVYFLYSIISFLQNYWMIGIAQKTVYSMRTDLFDHLHKLPIRFFDQKQHGDLMSRVTNDIENVSRTLNQSVIQVFSSILTLTLSISVMFYLSPFLTFVTLFIVPLMFAGMKWITKRTKRLFKEQQQNLGELNGFIEEAISNQKAVKMFSKEEKVIEQFAEKNEKLRQSGFWAQTYTGFIPKLMNILNNLSFTVVAAVGGYLALKGKISIGTIVVFTEYSRQFTRPLNDLANQFNTLLSAIAGAERVFEIMDLEVEEKENEKVKYEEFPSIKGEVQFKDVNFSYEKGNPTIINTNFHVHPGETVAFVGPTGSGKTTMIHLLSRFYDVDSGVILMDGRPNQTIKREQLRKFMGFVLQDSFIFEGTIKENIRYGRLDATDEEVKEAAKLANAHSFIMKLPDGYDTVLHKGGAGISQGQKQLLSIARALLADPVILILDEATSSIDTVTEVAIQEALQQLMKGRTSFVIAHRLNTIRNADQIFVLKEGRIIERGTHETLLENRGFYYELNTGAGTSV